MDTDAAPVLTLLQAYLATSELPPDGRLPPERVLAEALGASRRELRKALAAMEAEGQLIRRVGAGTYLSPRPLAAIDEVASLAQSTRADDIVQARLILEPELAAAAAGRAADTDLSALQAAVRASRHPGLTWRGYELQDARLHREIAVVAGNPVLLFLYDHLAAVRRVMTWNRVRPVIVGPPQDHPSFTEHDRIVAAIAANDPDTARREMRDHVSAVHAAMNILDKG
jgi:DNA-binding FadR family transcriptional regulator